MQTVTQRVAEFVANFELEHAPDDVIEKAKVTLLHDLGVAMAGYQLAAPAFDLAKEFGACVDGGGARLPVDGTPVTVEWSTLAIGALIHARTQDDTQLSALTHLGCTTLPAILSIGDRSDSSGVDFLAAMIAGYEAASAIAEDRGAQVTSRGFRATSVYGPLAAAAAASRLLGLSVDQTVSALGLAAAFGGGTNQTWVAGTGEWQYQVGSASRNGLVGALLASRGVSGAPDALEGRAGHHRCFVGDAEGAADAGIGLGKKWRSLTVTYKPFPICALNQVPATVMIDLVQQHDLREEHVQEVVVALAPHEAAYPGVDSQGPFSDVGGTLMSAPYCLAMGIRKQGIDLEDLRRFGDDSLMELVRRIHVVGEDGLPGGSCRITVRTRDDEFSDDYISTPETFNWDRHETTRRLRMIVRDMPFGVDHFDRIVDAVLDLDNRSIRELISAMLV